MEKVALIFPGQGSQCIGMAMSLYKELDIVRKTFEEASDILGFEVPKFCFEGTLSELSSIDKIQPVLLTVSIALYRAYMEQIGFEPRFCAGHSLGEYSALTCAGILLFKDALKILEYRGALSKEVLDSKVGTMTIIEGLDSNVVEAVCKEKSKDERFVGINCYNTHLQFSIAGHRSAVEEAEEEFLDLGARVTPLLTSAPFHSPIMSAVIPRLQEELSKYTYHSFKWPVVTNLTGKPHIRTDNMLEHLSDHMTKPVQWYSTMSFLKQFGVTSFVEMGPKNVLTNMTKTSLKGVRSFCYGIKEDRTELYKLITQSSNFKKEQSTFVSKCITAAVATPNANNNTSEYMKGVIEPYKKLCSLNEKIKTSNSKASQEEMKEAVILLKCIFKTKKVTLDEQVQWFHQIIDENYRDNLGATKI